VRAGPEEDEWEDDERGLVPLGSQRWLRWQRRRGRRHIPSRRAATDPVDDRGQSAPQHAPKLVVAGLVPLCMRPMRPSRLCSCSFWRIAKKSTHHELLVRVSRRKLFAARMFRRLLDIVSIDSLLQAGMTRPRAGYTSRTLFSSFSVIRGTSVWFGR
jgi:hypothetical protein